MLRECSENVERMLMASGCNHERDFSVWKFSGSLLEVSIKLPLANWKFK